jgi:CheY-like chemotaxis protein
MSSDHARRAEKPMAGIRVLLAEDEFMIALNISSELESRGASVTVVDSVADGLALGGEHFDVALLDVRLADGDVHPLAEVLRDRGISLVFHTGHEDAGSLSARYPGAIAFSKPTRMEVLADGVGRAAAA